MKKLSIICIIIAGTILFSGCIGEKSNSKPSTSEAGEPATSPSRFISPYDNYTCIELLGLIERVNPGLVNASVFPGELPPDIPFAIPIQENAVIVGSIVYNEEKYPRIEIFLDISEEPSEISNFYQNNLKKSGWNELESYSEAEKGFVDFSMSDSTIFCRYEEKGPSLTILSYPYNKEMPVDVMLILDTDPQDQICSMPPEETRAANIMPLLQHPKTVEVWGGGVSINENHYSSEATLKTDLSITELEDHYRNQLIEVGWESIDNVSGNSIVFSTWYITDELGDQWSGILSINQVGKSDMRFVYFSIQMV